MGLVGEDGGCDSVVIWPSDTTVAGAGESISITSLGITVHIGDSIEAVTQNGLAFPEFTAKLPPECQGSDLMDLRLGE